MIVGAAPPPHNISGGCCRKKSCGERETDAEPEAAEPEALEAEGIEPEAAEDEVDNATARYVFGLTLDQIDEIELLLAMVMAHGDVVISADDGEFARNTMSQMGQAIFTDVEKLREIIRDVNNQRLRPLRHVLNRVGEEPAVYHAGVAYLPAYRASHSAWPLPARRKMRQGSLALVESLRGGR